MGGYFKGRQTFSQEFPGGEYIYQARGALQECLQVSGLQAGCSLTRRE